jgi:hypothetical protein
MSADPNKKSPRTFQCRDVLWDNFEQMARELECSVDYLVNEAMKQYARQRAAQAAGAGAGPASQGPGMRPIPAPLPGGGSQVGASYGPPSARLPPPPMPTRGGALPVPPPRNPGPPGPPSMGAPMRSAAPPALGAGLPLPPPPRGGNDDPPARPPSVAPPPPPAALGRTMASPLGAPPPAFRAPAPPPPPAQPAYAEPAGFPQSTGTLCAYYQGDRVPVNKDRFIIGRGKQSSDLTLKDPNVSRQHAMVEYQNGVYFMVDMGSTNGVEYNGQRIARKQIAEGDTYRICDHEIRFSYR